MVFNKGYNSQFKRDQEFSGPKSPCIVTFSRTAEVLNEGYICEPFFSCIKNCNSERDKRMIMVFMRD